MPFRIASNIASIATQRHLDKSQRQAEKSMIALSSGSRVVHAGDDAAGFAIAESLRGQIAGSKQAKLNAMSAQSMIQTAEGGLNEQNNILIRLRELAVYSSSDTVGDVEREFLDSEYQQLTSEFDRIAKSTRFGNKQLLSGPSKDFEFQVGAFDGEENRIDFTLDADTTSSSVGISGLSITDQDDARSALSDIDEALTAVARTRAELGAAQSRFQFAIDNLGVQYENLSAARSTIIDVDVAEEVSNLARAQVLQDVGSAVLTQANSDAPRVLRMING